ncbi:hypothetical protein NDU88_002658 [Pleurodeles waltl]|uniref:Uncharacterized protein n=1 Tax=Pleurodeles waltl TaxID=8319 RepID=A0AAV7M410_PLEWA|nr:hypothetical protein NDU88_002658 [Pleurodeles waltl]
MDPTRPEPDGLCIVQRPGALQRLNCEEARHVRLHRPSWVQRLPQKPRSLLNDCEGASAEFPAHHVFHTPVDE